MGKVISRYTIAAAILFLMASCMTTTAERFNPQVQHPTDECYTTSLDTAALRQAALADLYLWELFCGDEKWPTPAGQTNRAL